ncbi:MAG TPA: phosphatidate cytidylyltransferase [Gammaproteobacteria bacterium]|mgnify:FL=1|jgi:CDP-diglyceride synthetase|nr:phosphatidate cytidylyltransferase [Gammaproteobacteria bacterium]HJP43217.1 phosphatidate cytidylyltransferase [Gammaproteobacteria bacterium]|tara:strand:+ start:194 stop:1021 length:828 start_codon:yes stop_codon:yes gene_type:complete
MKNITKRICSAAVLILILIYLTQDSTANLAKIVVATLLSLIIVWEYSRLFKSRIYQALFQILFVSFVLSAPYLTGILEKTSNYFFGLLVFAWVVILFRVLTYKKKNIDDFLVFIFGYLTLLPFVGSLFTILIYPGILLYVVITVSIADSSAYLVGRKVGKTALLPNISPGKTIEGFVGSLIITPIISSLIVYLFYGEVVIGFLFIGFFVTLISVIGDLFFSLLKRNKNIKDSSNLIPGHGGFIDLLDGTIAVLPLLAFLFFKVSYLSMVLSVISF